MEPQRREGTPETTSCKHACELLTIKPLELAREISNVLIYFLRMSIAGPKQKTGLKPSTEQQKQNQNPKPKTRP